MPAVLAQLAKLAIAGLPACTYRHVSARFSAVCGSASQPSVLGHNLLMLLVYLVQAMRLMDLYSCRGIGPDRVYIKLASTWEGVEACRKLQKQGVDCNMTLLFSFGQVGLARAATYACCLQRSRLGLQSIFAHHEAASAGRKTNIAGMCISGVPTAVVNYRRQVTKLCCAVLRCRLLHALMLVLP